ncbi:hypothetical protein [Parvibaculum sp.]|jgi:hypothetical protein|uniref:hypothetical protein n=1 Tax=Parvibaculum sp. TaxID=2024848 RepID=UPI001B02ABAA|nr:hypothetical protein [Parvibaculum sp.]MBO6633967.1 hypothetical protein [Parvibaculum sp.]MBO6677555.1 hypothetical protein [Parvibaculum sp.]MBO6685348.1 hypothetical protein [Parvibaculum sp.]MBO6905216.1 hypothetical protein [Parvibaculum sp.]
MATARKKLPAKPQGCREAGGIRRISAASSGHFQAAFLSKAEGIQLNRAFLAISIGNYDSGFSIF